ncbi:MAG TPA: type 4a pilus biogenesis protein PilO [Acidimicrobiales bacterium]|nr:type 4a pilus biogenesis protein PilO [Acidimicrobiales bacterium]
MEELKRFQVPLAIVVGGIVLVAVLYLAVVSPQSKKLTSLDTQKTQLTNQLTGLQAEIETLRKEKAQFVPNCLALGKALTEIPSTTDASSFLQQVTNLAKQSGDPNTPSYSLPETGLAKNGVTEIQFTMTLAGTYGQMTSFVQGLGTLPRLFTVSTISITTTPVTNIVEGGGQTPASNTAGFNLNMTGGIYYSTSQKDVCGSLA